jgi:folate-binding protein YgfZ
VNRPTFEEQYATVVNGIGFMPLDGWNTVRVTGADRATFLHNMCTNDVKGLSAGESCEAFFTDVKGKIVAHAFIMAGEDAIDLLLSPGQAERLILHLDRYIIREDVRLADVSGELCWLLVLGARATEAIGEGDASFRTFKCDAAWCGRFFVATDGSRVAEMHSRLAKHGAVECPSDAWQAIRVESAWPLFGVDFDSSNLPQEVNRDNKAIHFRKGCYLGQETIARIDALGHVNKKMVQVRFEGDEPPQSSSELRQAEQVVGQVTSSCWSPRWKAPLALAMVRRGANDIGAALQCRDQSGEVVTATAPT